MSILGTIILVILGFYALLWLSCFAVVALAYIRHKLKDKNVNKQIHEIKVDTPINSSTDASEKLIQTNLTDEKIIPPKSIVVIDNEINKITSLIDKHKNNNVALLAFGSMLGLDADEIIGGNSDLAGKFQEYCNAITRKDNFSHITLSRIKLGEYTESFEEFIDVYYNIFLEEFFDRFELLLFNFKGYFDLIDQKQSIIASKKKELVTQNEFGDFDGSEWVKYLQRFAIKTELVNPKSFARLDFEPVREYFNVINLDNFQGRYLGYLHALAEHFQKRADPLANVITGIDFEMYLKSQIESAIPDAYVDTTPASGDHGADLIARYKGITIAIQAKYYSGSVGNAAVQEIHAGMGFYDADFGMVVTQSTYTEHAKSLANKLGIHLEDVDSFIDKLKYLAN
jgi:restriction system protein